MLLYVRVSRRLLGWKDVLRCSPRIGTAKGSSLDQSKDLAWLELGMVSLGGNPTAEKFEINGACLGLTAGELGLR